jgi:XTP/dITP diphosphohydrolase
MALRPAPNVKGKPTGTVPIPIPRAGRLGQAPRVTTFVIATRNRHKVEEIRAVLGTGFTCQTLADFPGAPAVVEDAASFAGNAAKKALELAAWLGSRPELSRGGAWFVLADDSGLEVDALGGAPGVRSARFAAADSGGSGNSTDAENNAKLLELLRDVPAPRRTARFRCAIALVPAGPAAAACGSGAGPEVFEGVCEGRVLPEARGECGFGYDPLFQPLGYTATFAELGEPVKNEISHRARALEQLRSWLARTGRAAEPGTEPRNPS